MYTSSLCGLECAFYICCFIPVRSHAHSQPMAFCLLSFRFPVIFVRSLSHNSYFSRASRLARTHAQNSHPILFEPPLSCVIAACDGRLYIDFFLHNFHFFRKLTQFVLCTRICYNIFPGLFFRRKVWCAILFLFAIYSSVVSAAHSVRRNRKLDSISTDFSMATIIVFRLCSSSNVAACM